MCGASLVSNDAGGRTRPCYAWHVQSPGAVNASGWLLCGDNASRGLATRASRPGNGRKSGCLARSTGPVSRSWCLCRRSCSIQFTPFAAFPKRRRGRKSIRPRTVGCHPQNVLSRCVASRPLYQRTQRACGADLLLHEMIWPLSLPESRSRRERRAWPPHRVRHAHHTRSAAGAVY